MLRWLIVIFLALVFINGLSPLLQRLGWAACRATSSSSCLGATGSFRWPAPCCSALWSA
jgi:hypothetical protein